MSERTQFITAMRELADFLESHESAPLPSYMTVNAFVEDAETFKAVTRSLGRVEKRARDEYFWLVKPFGSTIAYEVNIRRDKICRKISEREELVPAQIRKVVEWECAESVLAGNGDRR